MADYALVQKGVVINTVVWDGETKVDFGSGVTAIELAEGQIVNAGYSYKNGVFTAPPPTEEEISNQQEAAAASNLGTKDALMSEATLRISVLQDAVDLEMATDEETAALPLWKKFRVLLSRIEAETAEAIIWPEKPE